MQSSGKPTLLIVWHSRTGASEALAAEAAQAARISADVRLLRADDAQPAAFRAARGYLFVGPENLGALSGAMKEMLDRCYYPLLGQIEGRPYATIIAAGSDGAGAQSQLDRIVTGWRLKRIASPMIVNFDAQTPEAILARKTPNAKMLKDCAEMAQGFAEGLSLGVF